MHAMAPNRVDIQYLVVPTGSPDPTSTPYKAGESCRQRAAEIPLYSTEQRVGSAVASVWLAVSALFACTHARPVSPHSGLVLREVSCTSTSTHRANLPLLQMQAAVVSADTNVYAFENSVCTKPAASHRIGTNGFMCRRLDR